MGIALGKKFAGIGRKFEDISDKIHDRIRKPSVTARAREGKGGGRTASRRNTIIKRVVIALVAVGVLVLVISLSVTVEFDKTKDEARNKTSLVTPASIDRNELFLPPEPDAAPKFAQPREKRDSWNAATLEQYWTPPSKMGANTGSDYWKKELKNAVDAFLEAEP
jgi:hypothetical protein